jgi:hypothetical protein
MRHHENECPEGSQDSLKCIHRQQKLADIAVGHELKDRNPRPTLSSKHQQISTPTRQHISQVSHQLQKKLNCGECQLALANMAYLLRIVE